MRQKKSLAARRSIFSLPEQLENRALLSAMVPSWGLEPSAADRDAYFSNWYATDSASAGTAMATGVKTDDGNVAWRSGDPANGALTTIAEQLRAENGFAIGVASTVPFNHATPACFVSHNTSRNNYYAIASEIITSVRPEVVIGGYGSSYTAGGVTGLITSTPGWTLVHREAGVDGNGSLLSAAASVDLSAGERLFGLFGTAGGNFEYHTASDSGSGVITSGSIEDPTLPQTVEATINVLNQDQDGFFVMFEQGDIDWTNHANDYENMIGGVWDLDLAVRKAEAMVSAGQDGMNWKNTLIIVTSDHSNSYMRLNEAMPLGKGELPEQVWADKNGNKRIDNGEWTYPGGEVQYSTTGHTNELVSIYARGRHANLFNQFKNEFHPGTGIVDNTHIHEVMSKAADMGVRHIMLFVGDGMNIAHEVAGSRYLYGTDNGLAWQNWGKAKDGWAGYCTTWDVTTYNKNANALGVAPYDVNTFDPMVGYNPSLGGKTPVFTFSSQPAATSKPAAAAGKSLFQSSKRIIDDVLAA